jgi:hypothetical protein
MCIGLYQLLQKKPPIILLVWFKLNQTYLERQRMAQKIKATRSREREIWFTLVNISWATGSYIK